MATSKDLINQALRGIGVIAAGEQADSDTLNDSYLIARQMIEAWSLQRLLVPAVIHESFAISAIGSAGSYTMGSGGDIDTARALNLVDCRVAIGTTDHTVTITSLQQWAGIGFKSSVSLPNYVYFEPSYPLSKLYFSSVIPTEYTLKLVSWKELSALPELNSDTEYPPGYDRAIRLNLEVELAPAFERPVNAVTASLARNAKREIKQLNSTPMTSRVDVGLLKRRYGYDINSGP